MLMWFFLQSVSAAVVQLDYYRYDYFACLNATELRKAVWLSHLVYIGVFMKRHIRSTEP